MINIKPIKSEAKYQEALESIDALMDSEDNSTESDTLEILATLVSAYEDEHYPIDAPDPVEFIKNVLEFRGEKQKDFALIIGSSPRASEFFNRQRALSLTQIRKIIRAWKVPPMPLLGVYPIKKNRGENKVAGASAYKYQDRKVAKIKNKPDKRKRA
jgi:HTH-type transcriptional regulator / antitoxin HigA